MSSGFFGAAAKKFSIMLAMVIGKSYPESPPTPNAPAFDAASAISAPMSRLVCC